MGNLLPQEVKKTSVYSRTKSKFLCMAGKKTSTNRQTDEFIIAFHKQSTQSNHKVNNVRPLDQRRTVFISLIGLYQTFEECPSHVLYPSLLIMPLKREWIINPNLYIDELHMHFATHLSLFYKETDKVKRFIQLLIWKDSQNLVFWCLDEHVAEDNHSSIDPFWKCLSQKVSCLYDPVHRSNYKPLILEEKRWMKLYDGEHHKSMFGANKSSIFTALYFPWTMKYKPMQEILYQSNSDSLNPVVWFGQNVDTLHCFVSAKSNPSLLYTDDGNYHDEEEGEWFISTDYDPYDV